MHLAKRTIAALVGTALMATHAPAAGETIVAEADLLVVGGTESGCAAAIQAADGREEDRPERPRIPQGLGPETRPR